MLSKKLKIALLVIIALCLTACGTKRQIETSRTSHTAVTLRDSVRHDTLTLYYWIETCDTLREIITIRTDLGAAGDTLRQDTTVNRDRSRRSDVKAVMRTASDKEIRLSEQDSTLRGDTINTHPPDIAVRKASTTDNLLSIIRWTFATILAVTLLVLILKFGTSRL